MAGQSTVPTHDQRGAPFGRVFGGRIDIGAVEVRPVPAADFDFDLDVDGHDFLRWQRGVGKPNATKGDGDADGNGIVNGVDLGTWKAAFGTVTADGAAAPSAAVARGVALARAVAQADAIASASTAAELADAALADRGRSSGMGTLDVGGFAARTHDTPTRRRGYAAWNNGPAAASIAPSAGAQAVDAVFGEIERRRQVAACADSTIGLADDANDELTIDLSSLTLRHALARF